jgi:hypothetical protein
VVLQALPLRVVEAEFVKVTWSMRETFDAVWVAKETVNSSLVERMCCRLCLVFRVHSHLAVVVDFDIWREVVLSVVGRIEVVVPLAAMTSPGVANVKMLGVVELCSRL